MDDLILQKQARLSQERLREVLHYDPDTGLFTWNGSRSAYPRTIAGQRAGWTSKSGYISIKIDRLAFRAHRLAWFYMTGQWPADEVDHKNHDRADNRWSNLREATRHQNQANSVARKSNTTGLKGIVKRGSKWNVVVNANGKRHYVGTFLTEAEALDARQRAAEQLTGEFALQQSPLASRRELR